MSIIQPEIEFVDRSTRSIRYLEHGWPTDLCRWHSHEEYELHFIVETRGKAFVGDYIGDFGPGALYLTGPPGSLQISRTHRGCHTGLAVCQRADYLSHWVSSPSVQVTIT